MVSIFTGNNVDVLLNKFTIFLFNQLPFGWTFLTFFKLSPIPSVNKKEKVDRKRERRE